MREPSALICPNVDTPYGALLLRGAIVPHSPRIESAAAISQIVIKVHNHTPEMSYA
jgi:hypothetical protein